MKKKNFLYFFLLIFFFNSTNTVGSIVFIDIDFVIKNSYIGKISLKKLENINNENLESLKKAVRIKKFRRRVK